MKAPSRNLVIVRAGDASLHPGWTKDLARRDWDLVVSYFGSDPERFRGPGERRIDDPGPKFRGLHALLTREDFWRGYERIWLAEDDLAADQEGISRLFARSREWDLALSQPALSWASHASYPVTVRHPSLRLLCTNMVEIMAPCFTREALEACLPTFAETITGWGLSWVWPARLGCRSRTCGIIHDVEITHTRPVGGPLYRWLEGTGLSAPEERRRTLERHGLPADPARPTLFAALTAEGAWLDPVRAEDRAVLFRLLASDWNAYLASPLRPREGGPAPAGEQRL